MAGQAKESGDQATGETKATGRAGRGKGANQADGVVTIKKYANRRLYNTATSSYVTLDHLCAMVKDGVDFAVYDAKSGDDITRAVLTQIIVEEEAKGQHLLPISFLRQLIGFYGDNLQMVVPRYLETSMSAFAQNQERMRSYMQDAFGAVSPFAPYEEMAKRNVAMFENAMRMFNPMGAAGMTPKKSASEPSAGKSSGQGAGGDETAAAVQQLKSQLDALQAQLETMNTKASSKE